MTPPRRIYLPPVPRVRPAGSWSPLTGFFKMVRPVQVPVGRFLRPVQGIPLTGGQGATTVSSASGGAPTAPIQTATGTATSGTTVTVTLSPTGTGNCLVAYIGAIQGTTNPTVSGITLGGLADNWAVAKAQNNNADTNVEIWTDRNAAAGKTSVVVTFAAGTGTGQGNAVRVEEWPGVLTGSSPVDQTAGANGVSTTPSSGATSTLSQANELVVGAISANQVPAGPASPWTNEAAIGPAGLGLVTGYQVVSSTAAQTYAGTMSSGSWGAAVVSLKLAPIGPVVVAGVATISVGPQGLGNVWYPAQVTVQTSSGAADASTCSIYLGPAGVPVTLVATIFPGGIGTAALAVPPMQPGDYLIAQWTGGNPGDAAAVNVIGTMDSLMPG